jgi:hypothetical protein
LLFWNDASARFVSGPISTWKAKFSTTSWWVPAGSGRSSQTPGTEFAFQPPAGTEQVALKPIPQPTAKKVVSGGAYHLTDQCRGASFVVLEEQESFGGTWRTHRYPDIRSDSDL